MSFIRASALQRYTELVTEFGGDSGSLVRAAGVRAEDVGNAERFIPFSAFVQLLEGAAAQVGRPDFGRVLAARQDEAMLGPLGAAATTAPTLGAGLAVAEQFVAVFSPAITISMERGVPDSVWSFRVNLPDIGPHPQTLELLLRRTVSLAREHVLGGYVPKAVLLPHPPLGGAVDYFRSFGTEVRFQQATAGLMVRTADLDRPLRSDPEVHRLVSRYVEQLLPGEDEPVGGAVRRVVERALPAGAPGIADVARLMNTSVRTLQRRLSQEDTTFDELVDGVRRQLVEGYLRDGRLTIGEVARLLGYSHQSAFTRSCRRWFGATPSQLRRELLG